MNMEEQKLVERPLMNEEEFKAYMEKNRIDVEKDFYERNILHLRTYEAVRKYKSLRRAIRRGHVTLDGIVMPDRPFNNRANNSNRKGRHSRVTNEKKKMIYGKIKYRQSA